MVTVKSRVEAAKERLAAGPEWMEWEWSGVERIGRGSSERCSSSRVVVSVFTFYYCYVLHGEAGGCR